MSENLDTNDASRHAGTGRKCKDDFALFSYSSYLLQGEQSFNDGFRVLCAGGGTGTSTNFLAEQLRHRFKGPTKEGVTRMCDGLKEMSTYSYMYPGKF